MKLLKNIYPLVKFYQPEMSHNDGKSDKLLTDAIDSENMIHTQSSGGDGFTSQKQDGNMQYSSGSNNEEYFKHIPASTDRESNISYSESQKQHFVSKNLNLEQSKVISDAKNLNIESKRKENITNITKPKKLSIYQMKSSLDTRKSHIDYRNGTMKPKIPGRNPKKFESNSVLSTNDRIRSNIPRRSENTSCQSINGSYQNKTVNSRCDANYKSCAAAKPSPKSDRSSKAPLISKVDKNTIKKESSTSSYYKTKNQINKFLAKNSIFQHDANSKLTVRETKKISCNATNVNSIGPNKGISNGSNKVPNKISVQERCIRNVRKLTNRSAPEGVMIRKLAREKSSEFLLCPKKKEYSRNVELKSAKITKNLKLCNRDPSSFHQVTADTSLSRFLNETDSHTQNENFPSISTVVDSSFTSNSLSIQESWSRPSSNSLGYSESGIPDRRSPSVTEMFASKNLLLEDPFSKNGYVTMIPRCNTLGIPPPSRYERMDKPKVSTLPNRKHGSNSAKRGLECSEKFESLVDKLNKVKANASDDVKLKPSSRLVSICNRVTKEHQFPEFTSPYPVDFQLTNKYTTCRTLKTDISKTKPPLEIEISVLHKQTNLHVKDLPATDEQKSSDFKSLPQTNTGSCEATEAAQLEQKLRSLGCELVTLRSKLPPSIHSPSTPMSPTQNSSDSATSSNIIGTTKATPVIEVSPNEPPESSKDPDPIKSLQISKQQKNSDGMSGVPLEAQEVDDLIHLGGPLTEDAVLKTLHARFMTQRFYTNVGPILLSINSYVDVGNALTLTSTKSAHQSPHLLRIVHEAVRQQSETGYPQAIILSGASGSGKTYMSMLLLRQLFDVAGGGPETDAFKHLSAAFTVLRSLGSAKTTTNSESSRIGHFIEVQVTDGALYRTKIHCYFLDQTRVVTPLPDEKNYHIFYQMLAGLSPEERVKLHLQGHSVRTLRYLSGGDVHQDEANDARRFESWKACLGVLGIQVLDVVRVLAAILLLGNVSFIEGQGLEVDIQGGSHELKSVADLLGVSPAALYSGLTTRTHNVRGQLVKSMCDANMSNMTRDALSKALYCRTVATIVRRANSLKRLGSTSGTLSSDSNESVHHQADVASRHASTVGTACSKASKSMSVLNSAVKHATDGFIGILDMFGFEEPKPAHLEHLCINLCAETMQHFYNTHIFKSSIESCREEGIACEVEVDYVDNVPCIDLISSLRTGLLSILDLECSVRSTPENYIQKVRVQHKGNTRLFEPKSNMVRTFGIHHFANRVVYDASNFLDTNKDIISDDLVSVFQKPTCNFGFASHLFGSELKALYSQEPVPRGVAFRISPTSHTDLQNGYEPVSTLTQDFHTRLDNLLRTLVHAKPHFIRCIRANASEKPNYFDRATVIKQIRALQVLETVNLMAGGFPHRMRFKTFSLRYRLLAPFTKLRRTEDKTVEDCKLILECFMKKLEDIQKHSTVLIQWALGKRHIFLSEGARQQLEILRIETRHRSATHIQTVWKGWHLRRKWPALRRNLELRARTRTIRPRPQPIAGTPPPENLDRCAQKAIQQTCSRIGLDLERPPPVPPSRSYTITGNHKLGYPQNRVMKMTYPEDGSGDAVLRKGQTVLVVGASSRRGNLLVEHQGHSVHVPFQFMELNAQTGVAM